MISYRLLVILVLGLLYQVSFGQHINPKIRKVAVSPYPIKLDGLTIIPASLRVSGCEDSLSYRIDLSTSTLYWLDTSTLCDSVTITYRTLSTNLGERYSIRSLEAYDSTPIFRDQSIFKNPQLDSREELFGVSGLQKNGNIARGISFGNTQDVFVNSVLNLQLEGKISEELTLTAAISDQNIPFQPEGNTQQLQEFDRVYIQLDHEQGRLTAGDLILKNPDSHFIRYFKNVQGGQATVRYKLSENSKAETTAGVAVAKGKFASQLVPVLEGVIGPYRLKGPNNERFIIVIANSEKVFLDGRQLTRGFDYDYVIDYNQGEITFTNRIVITQFTRIRVDFEFSERNYSRSITQAAHVQDIGKLRLKMNWYREADNPRNPLVAELSNEDKQILADAGDNPLLALGSGVDSVGFIERQILYRRVDTVVNSVAYPAYVYSTDPSVAVFRLTFAEVGIGLGNYIFTNNTANGRIFTWVAPLGGVPQGNFEPIRQLPTPKELGMATFGLEYATDKGHVWYTEMAASVNDLNRFSSLDGGDDRGAAFKLGYRSTQPFAIGKGYKMGGSVDYEFNQSSFTFIDRLRTIEFDRDWSADPQSASYLAAENLLHSSLLLDKDINNQLRYEGIYRKRGEEVNGTQQKLTLTKKLGLFQSTTDAFYLSNSQLNRNSEWIRLSQDVHIPNKYIVPGYQYSLDQNEVKASQTDSIIFTAMHFEEHRFYLRSSDSSKLSWLADYAIRYDNAPSEGRMIRANRAETANLRFRSIQAKSQELTTTFTYRKLETALPGIETPPEENLTGRLDWNASMLKNIIRSEMTYAIGTGRELRREYIYLQVPIGEGTHFWRDINGDNNQDLDEFFPAVTTDQREFIRLFVPTDEYIKAYTNSMAYRLNVNMPSKWRTKGWTMKQLSRLSSVASITLDNRVTLEDLMPRLNPLSSINVRNLDLISTAQNGRATIFYNRSNPSYGADIGWSRASVKSLITGGFETRSTEDVRLGFRKNIASQWNTQTILLQQTRYAESDVLLARNFEIESREASEELAFQPTNSLRVSGNYAFTSRKNVKSASDQFASALIQKIGMEARVNQVLKRTISLQWAYINISYQGEPGTQIAIEMLEALLPGSNFTWSLNWQQKLSNGLQLTINYEGRKSGDVPVVHIGRMQVNALF